MYAKTISESSFLVKCVQKLKFRIDLKLMQLNLQRNDVALVIENRISIGNTICFKIRHVKLSKLFAEQALFIISPSIQMQFVFAFVSFCVIEN